MCVYIMKRVFLRDKQFCIARKYFMYTYFEEKRESERVWEFLWKCWFRRGYMYGEVSVRELWKEEEENVLFIFILAWDEKERRFIV